MHFCVIWTFWGQVQRFQINKFWNFYQNGCMYVYVVCMLLLELGCDYTDESSQMAAVWYYIRKCVWGCQNSALVDIHWHKLIFLEVFPTNNTEIDHCSTWTAMSWLVFGLKLRSKDFSLQCMPISGKIILRIIGF